MKKCLWLSTLSLFFLSQTFGLAPSSELKWLELLKSVKTLSMSDEEQYDSILNDFSPVPPTGSTLDEKIVSVLLGSRKIRQGSAPSEDQKQHLMNTVRFYTENNLPVDLVVLWGARKGYGVFEDFLEADAFDLFALRRFSHLQKQIKEIYPKGIRVTVVIEDLTGVLISGEEANKISPLIKIYHGSLLAMISQFKMSGFIRIKTESGCVLENGHSLQDFISLVHQNAEVIYQYWLALKRNGFTNTNSIPEFEQVKKIGWQGNLASSHWEYYIERAATEHPSWSEDRRARCVCLYLGNALARYQWQVLTLREKDKILKPVKVSFVPYPKGTADSLYFGRIEYKVKDGQKYNVTTPPWAGYALKNFQTGDFDFYSVRQLKELLTHSTTRFNGRSLLAYLKSA